MCELRCAVRLRRNAKYEQLLPEHVRPPSSPYVAPPVYIYRERPKGIRFSRVELYQLTIAILALSLALTLLFVRPLLFGGSGSAGGFAVLLGLSFVTSLVAVATGVGLHEIAHKLVAQRYGHWAEFRYNPMGLLLAFVFAFLGFIYGAPGATWISGAVTTKQNGRISAAGPGTNIVLGSFFLGIAWILSFAYSDSDIAAFALRLVVNSAAFINLVLAGFNMIPVMPLDGAKVWAWDKRVYFAIVGIVVALFVGGYLGGFLL